MPKCLNCGNSSHFNSRSIPKSTPWNNGPNSGLVGLFNESSLINMENQGVNYEDLNHAWSKPYLYFD